MIVNGTARFVNGLMGTLTGNVIGNVSGSASYATSSDTANYINLVATNEIRFYKTNSKEVLYILVIDGQMVLLLL